MRNLVTPLLAVGLAACALDLGPMAEVHVDPQEAWVRVTDVREYEAVVEIAVSNSGPDDARLDTLTLEGDPWHAFLVDPGGSLPARIHPGEIHEAALILLDPTGIDATGEDHSMELSVDWTPIRGRGGELEEGIPAGVVVPVFLDLPTECDLDNDGWDAESCGGDDCDDSDDTVHPGADEVCNERDDDCDHFIDEDAVDAAPWYIDADGDGWGETHSSTVACEAPSRHVSTAGDCDDEDAAVFPGAVEVCNEVDDDCNGWVDDDAVDMATRYPDRDGDGYGDPESPRTACDLPRTYVEDHSDCDDGVATIHPGATEYCNDLDDDCNGAVDDDAADESTWYADTDGDGWGDPHTSWAGCDKPAGYNATARDCDDGDAEVHPGAEEVCDGVDQDCDGTADDHATDMLTWYLDLDGDGYGDAASSTEACDQPSYYVADDQDCDDLDDSINPGATEICDDVDQDCDGEVDEDATDSRTWYADADGDGYGDPATSADTCEAPTGYVSDDQDCDDADDAQYPGAAEFCNGEDDDCDGSVDEDAVDESTWYADADGDGYGDPASSSESCTLPAGHCSNDDDCDDSDADIHPGVEETCDGVDEDCDGTIDEDAVDGDTWYADDDSDGYGDDATTTTACELPSGYAAEGGDCDDADAGVSPGAHETCNGVDDDCDGTADGWGIWYADADGDGYGDPSSPVIVDVCSPGSGYADDDDDCDDSDEEVHPAAADACDTVDNDCSGVIDDGGLCLCDVEWDEDGDPYQLCALSYAWDWAEWVCEYMDYHLVTIDDADEDELVDEWVDDYGASDLWWFGANDRASEATWEWVDGSTSTYENWGPGEPAGGGTEDCGVLNDYADGTWGDWDCTDTLYFVCEAF